MSPSLRARLRRPLATLRRDLRAATAGLRGEVPPPFVPRDGSAWSTATGTRRQRVEPGTRAERPTMAWQVSLRSEDGERSLIVPAGQTILGAAQAAGIDLAHSCAVGGCGTCRHHLVSGRVSMEEPNCLTEEEREEGSVLLCVSRPLEPTVLERA